MHVIGHIHLGPAWKQGVSVIQQGAAMEQHLHYMQDLYERGSLLLGGPYAGSDGGMAVFAAESIDDAQRLADSDPAHRAGVIGYRLEPLNAVFDAATGVNRHDLLADLMASATDTPDVAEVDAVR